jgi:diphthamide biosynthesis protein 7
MQLHDQATIVCAPTDILALSLCWSASGREIVTSLSKGSCCIASGEDFQTLEHWPAHDYEAWIAAFDRFNDSVVYSGATTAL